jgi:hypothetical protein
MGKDTDLGLMIPGIPLPVSDKLTELIPDRARKILMDFIGRY